MELLIKNIQSQNDLKILMDFVEKLGLFETELTEEDSLIDDQRMQLVKEERERYLKGEGKSFSWDEVKDMAKDKEKRNAI